MKRIVTLTADWGQKDWFAACIKGRLISLTQDIDIVEVNTDVDKYNIVQGAFIVRNMWKHFPVGTINIVDVNSFEGLKTSFVCVKCEDRYFILSDNGLASQIFENENVEIRSLKIYSDSNYYTFAALDVFINAVDVLINNSFEQIGEIKDEFDVKNYTSKVCEYENSIVCKVIYIDDYGNVYLNLKDSEFETILKGRKFEVRIDVDVVINRISASYQDVQRQGKALLTISQTHHLQLALREDNFARLLGYEIGREVIINMM